jgi:myosin-crossreactive antigen
LSATATLWEMLRAGGLPAAIEVDSVSMVEEVSVVESAHPYTNDMRFMQRVAVPGARQYQVTFDPQSRTENG